MSSDRSNDDIQSELVEILGFEGDGLALVEELLRPGIREALMSDMRGGGHKASRHLLASSQVLTIIVERARTIP
jgi:antiviral helicase SLH1